MDNYLVCNLCKKPGKYVCQRCRDGYCSTNCQTLDWPKHKILCIPMPTLIPAPKHLIKTPNTSVNLVNEDVASYCQDLADISTLSILPTTKHSKPEHNPVQINESCVAEELKPNEKDIVKMFENRNWLTVTPLPTNEFFEAVVRYIEGENIVWIINASLREACDSLIKDINNETDSYEQCDTNDLLFGEIYCVLYQNRYYRGIIINKKGTTIGSVVIRLIDTGNLFEATIESIKHLEERHKKINAFAFPISTNRNLSIDEQVQIKILEKINNVYFVEFKLSPDTGKFHSILKELRETDNVIDGKIRIKKIFSKKKFLTVTTPWTSHSAFDNDKFQQTCLSNLYKSNSNIKIDSYMAGLTADGFQRGKVLAFYENLYVFASIDDAYYNLVNYILTIDKSFEDYPITVTICEIDEMSNENFFNKIVYKDNCLAIKIISKSNEYCKINILENNTILATGKLKKWNYSLSELNLNYWTIDIKSGTSVRITSAYDYNTLFICPEESINTYEKIFESLYSISETVTECMEKIDENVLFFYLNQENKPFRGISKYRDKNLFLIDLDTGIDIKVNNYKNLKRIHNDFAISAPVFTRKVQIRKFPSVVPPNVMQLVNDIIVKGYSFTLTYDNDDIDAGCDLVNTEGESIIALVNKNVSKCSNEEKLSTVPIPIGSDVELFILDVSQLESGIVTTCVNDLQMISAIVENDIKITEYCAAQKTQGYRPNIDELCLSKFIKDNRWYRTLCLKQLNPEIYLVIFVDYGNIDTVSYKDIIKITADFLYPSLAQTCVINNFTAAKLEKAKQVFTAHSIKKIDRIEKTNDHFLLFVNDLSD